MQETLKPGWRVLYADTPKLEPLDAADCASEDDAYACVRALKSQGRRVVHVESPMGAVIKLDRFFTWLCASHQSAPSALLSEEATVGV